MDNLLLSAVPDHVTIAGISVPINTDFRVGIQFEMLMQSTKKPDQQFVVDLVRLYYPKQELIQNLEEAVKQAIWFYSCGKPEEDKPKPSNKEILYSVEQDSEFVYAAFLQQYNIDLTIAKLHWWTYQALFSSLTDCKLTQVINYRGMDLSGLTPKQRKFYKEMKSLYRIKGANPTEKMSLAERNQWMKDYVKNRRAEIQKKIDEKKKNIPS